MITTVIINPLKQDREMMASHLSAGGEIKVLAQGKDGYDALKLVGRLKPDVAILDGNLEFIDGEEIPPLLRVRSPETAVVIVAAKVSDYQLCRAASNEVSGFVYKDTDMDRLPFILKCVSEGGCFISPFIARRVLQLLPPVSSKASGANNCSAGKTSAKASETAEQQSPNGDDPAKNLSKTELLILVQIGKGYTSEEIGKNLCLTVGTVRNYISSVMRKTGLNNRAQIVRYALSSGLVSPMG